MYTVQLSSPPSSTLLPVTQEGSRLLKGNRISTTDPSQRGALFWGSGHLGLEDVLSDPDSPKGLFSCAAVVRR